MNILIGDKIVLFISIFILKFGYKKTRIDLFAIIHKYNCMFHDLNNLQKSLSIHIYISEENMRIANVLLKPDFRVKFKLLLMLKIYFCA